MPFVIIAYTAISIIYGALILAVWWLPKEVNPPPIENEPLSPRQKVIRSMLMIITGVYALLLFPACFISFVAPWMMVGTGSIQSKFVPFLFAATIPFTITGSMIVAWILFRRRSMNIALSVTLLPIVQFVVSYFIPGIWSAP